MTRIVNEFEWFRGRVVIDIVSFWSIGTRYDYRVTYQ
jgi:hypothetical protein